MVACDIVAKTSDEAESGRSSRSSDLRQQGSFSLSLLEGLQLIAQDLQAHGGHCRILRLDGPAQVRQHSVCLPDAIEACTSHDCMCEMHRLGSALCLMPSKQHSTWKAAMQCVCLMRGCIFNMHQQRVRL
jgi:hypothetical protein